MAKFESAVFTRISNSFGNVTTYVARGINIFRAKTARIRNPRTLKQRVQRTRMAALVQLSQLFDEAIAIGFPGRPTAETVYNTFVRCNAEMVEVSDELKVTVDYGRLICSKGQLKAPTVSLTTDGEIGKVMLTNVLKNWGPKTDPMDQIYVFLVEKELQETKLVSLGKRNSTEPVSLTLQNGWEADNLVAYAFAVSPTMSKASATAYL